MRLHRGERWDLPEMMRSAIEGRTEQKYAWVNDGHVAVIIFAGDVPSRVNEIIDAVDTINKFWSKHYDALTCRAVRSGKLPDAEVLEAAMSLGGVDYLLKLIDENEAALESLDALKEYKIDASR